MTITAERASFLRRKVAGARASQLARPALGLLLPVGLAIIWEVAVRLGLSDGRLVPPPSIVYDTLADLARSTQAHHEQVRGALQVARLTP